MKACKVDLTEQDSVCMFDGFYIKDIKRVPLPPPLLPALSPFLYSLTSGITEHVNVTHICIKMQIAPSNDRLPLYSRV